MSLLGTTIGRIRLVELAGKGGMGEVFVGYDETLGRKVAVKCVSQDYRLNRKVAGRMLREARILSRLDHPNICQIYDLVHQDEGDFLILELVQGRELKEAMEQGLDYKSKLLIAQQIADVLVAAHAEGVIHRDLKPDNVMLTEEGDVKVLDFGIARSHELDEAHIRDSRQNIATVSKAEWADAAQPKAQGEGEHEEPEDTAALPTLTPGGTLIEIRSHGDNVMGTPRYMSPEQAKREYLTPASDMFSFGLLLQELLTEKSPYRRRLPLPTLLIDVAAGHSRPVEGQNHALTRLINELKSLQPSQRPTAKEAAKRLRWVRQQPKRRLQRAVALAISLIVLSLSAKYTLDLRREREAAIAARDQAEDLVAFMLEDLSSEFEPIGKLDMLGQVAHKALDYFERAAPGSAGEAAFLRGQAVYNVATVLDSQDELAEALSTAKTATDLHLALLSETPDHLEAQLALVKDYLLQSSVLGQLGRASESESIARQGLTLTSSLLQKYPENTPVIQAHGEANYSLGIHLLFIDQAKAEPHFLEAIALYERLAREQPENTLYKYRLAVLYGQGLGQAYNMRGLSEESFEAIQKAYGFYQELLSTGKFHGKWWYGFAWENRRRGDFFREQGKLQEALDAYRQAQKISERLLIFEPTQVAWRFGLGFDHASIGALQEKQGQLDEALASFHRAMEIGQSLAVAEPSKVEFRYWLANCQLNIGGILALQGQLDEAVAAWQQAAELSSKVAEMAEANVPCDPYDLEIHAMALLYLERIEEAKPLVAHLLARDWFESNANQKLVKLCRRYGLQIAPPVDEG